MATPEVYSKITEVNKWKPYSAAVLRAFIKTDKAFAEAMRGKVDLQKHGITERDEEWMDVTVLDLPTYKHLPQEFLSFSDAEKKDLIEALCIQNKSTSHAHGPKGEALRDDYIKGIALEAENLLRDHLHVAMPEKFNHRHITSVKDIIDFMNIGGLRSDNEKLYHCMFLKSIFLVHVIKATVDLEGLSKISAVIEKQIRENDNIVEVFYDKMCSKMHIVYTYTDSDKKDTQNSEKLQKSHSGPSKKVLKAVISFGEKSLESIFDKLARRAAYSSPDILNDLVRINIEFESGEGHDDARIWLLREIDDITFGPNRHNLKIEMSTREGDSPIIKPELFKHKTTVRDISDIHHIQVTGSINRLLPEVRGVKSFEVMCTESNIDFNKEGKGNRKNYKVERLQQAFGRLNTGLYGVLKPWQVKYALEDYARKIWVTDSPEELLRLLLLEKKFLIPVSILHGQNLCYRVRGVFRPEAKDLWAFSMQDKDLDPQDSEVFRRLVREFGRAKTSAPHRTKH